MCVCLCVYIEAPLASFYICMGQFWEREAGRGERTRMREIEREKERDWFKEVAYENTEACKLKIYRVDQQAGY